MSKMFRFVMLAAVAAMLIAPVAGAQKAPFERANPDPWWTDKPADETVKPGDGGSWSQTFSVTVKQDSIIYIGARNSQVNSHVKTCTLTVSGTGVENLTLVVGKGIKTDKTEAETDSTYSDGSGKFAIVIDPQPDFEWLKLRNDGTGSVTITGAAFFTYCYPETDPSDIPSLTTYGIIVLVLLLLASTVWVIRKKRARVPA